VTHATHQTRRPTQRPKHSSATRAPSVAQNAGCHPRSAAKDAKFLADFLLDVSAPCNCISSTTFDNAKVFQAAQQQFHERRCALHDGSLAFPIHCAEHHAQLLTKEVLNIFPWLKEVAKRTHDAQRAVVRRKRALAVLNKAIGKAVLDKRVPKKRKLRAAAFVRNICRSCACSPPCLPCVCALCFLRFFGVWPRGVWHALRASARVHRGIPGSRVLVFVFGCWRFAAPACQIAFPRRFVAILWRFSGDSAAIPFPGLAGVSGSIVGTKVVRRTRLNSNIAVIEAYRLNAAVVGETMQTPEWNRCWSAGAGAKKHEPFLKWWSHAATLARAARASTILQHIATFSKVAGCGHMTAVAPAWWRLSAQIKKDAKRMDFVDHPRRETDEHVKNRFGKLCQELRSRGALVLSHFHKAAVILDVRNKDRIADASTDHVPAFAV